MLVEGTYFVLALFAIAIAVIVAGGELTQRGVLKPQVRKIRGITSMEDAIDRCKEMGKPILYAGVGNFGYWGGPENIASLNILGFVSRKAADIGVPIWVGVHMAEILLPVTDVLETSARSVGKPEAFNPKSALYWSENYVTYFNGLLEFATNAEPAAFFDYGWICDENIVVPVYLAAHGIDCFCMTGCRAIQYMCSTLMGTDDWLLSEELFAAAAYSSQTKEAVGSVAMADWMKLLVWGLIVIGTIVTLAGSTAIIDLVRF